MGGLGRVPTDSAEEKGLLEEIQTDRKVKEMAGRRPEKPPLTYAQVEEEVL